jgi:hypothetical protein
MFIATAFTMGRLVGVTVKIAKLFITAQHRHETVLVRLRQRVS